MLDDSPYIRGFADAIHLTYQMARSSQLVKFSMGRAGLTIADFERADVLPSIVQDLKDVLSREEA